MTKTVKASRMLPITVDELAQFMNEGWPGQDWYLDECDNYLWGCAYTEGVGKELYKPCQPGTLVNLYDFEAIVRWQGYGHDPTNGRGYRFSDLVVQWRENNESRMIVIRVPTAKLEKVATFLKNAGCSFSL